MAPPKVICSVYADGLAAYAKLIRAIADVRAIVAKIIATKNKLKYGLTPLKGLASAAAAAIVAAASSVASAISTQVLTAASSLVSMAIEAVLAPILRILLSGPEALFSLVNLPLVEAISACDKERVHLSRARSNLNLVLSIFSKWTYEFGGGKYADKMAKALPFIIEAIDGCETVINKLDANEESGISAQFDNSAYNNMRSNILSAIDITESESMLVNAERLDDNISRKANAESKKEIDEIKKWHKTEKDKITGIYLDSKMAIVDTSVYNLSITKLDSQKKLKVEKAKLDATVDATLDKSVYEGIVNNPADQFLYDMQILGGAMQEFAKNMASAYGQYKISKTMTYSTYSIERLINILLEKMIQLIGGIGDRVGKALSTPLQLSKSLLIKVKEMYEESLDRYYSSNKSISSTGLATKLAGGNLMLTGVDATLTASVTKSLIEAVNADEAMRLERNKMGTLFDKIEEIQDWDGALDTWGTDPANSVTSPYVKLLASTAGVIGTLLTAGLTPNEISISANKKRLTSINKTFSGIMDHNLEVSAALRSYAPPISSDVEEFRKALGPLNLQLFLSGPTVFNIIATVANIAGDLFDGGINNFDVPTITNCKIAYPSLFEGQFWAAQAAHNSALRPATMNDYATSIMEQQDMDRVNAMGEIRDLKIPIDDSDMLNTQALT